MYDSQTIEMELGSALASISGLVSACELLMASGYPDIVTSLRSRLNSEICQSSRTLYGYCGDQTLLSKTAARRWLVDFQRVWQRARSVLEKLPANDSAHQPELAPLS